MPSSKGHSGDLSDPSFNFRYRIAYLIFKWMITAFILFNYSKLLEGVIPASNFYREFLICGGQIIWQFAIVSAIKKNKTWDYLGTLMTISFAGALLLSVGLVVSCFLSPAPSLFASYFLLVAAFMLLEHIRRSKILELSRIVTFTWVLYRILLLIVILYVQ